MTDSWASGEHDWTRTPDDQRYTRADMAAAWHRGYGERPLYNRDGTGTPPVACPYDDVPLPTGDWSKPETRDFCQYCSESLDLSGDDPELAPWPCDDDRLHCKGCVGRCPACRYLDDDRTSLTNTDMLG